MTLYVNITITIIIKTISISTTIVITITINTTPGILIHEAAEWSSSTASPLISPPRRVFFINHQNFHRIDKTWLWAISGGNEVKSWFARHTIWILEQALSNGCAQWRVWKYFALIWCFFLFWEGFKWNMPRLELWSLTRSSIGSMMSSRVFKTSDSARN